jgi:hypothetical protein
MITRLRRFPCRAGKSKRSALWMAVAILLLLVGSSHTAYAQFEVQDPWVFLEDVLQLQRMGDPALIQSITGAEQLVQSLGKKGVGIALAQLQKDAAGSNALSYVANGIYRAIPATIVTDDGATEQPRALDDYKKVDAVNKASDNFNAVVDDTEQRRQELRAQIKNTTVSAETALTEAEVQKVQTVLTSQTGELAAIDDERQAAVAKVLVQDAQNHAQETRDRQAKIEEQAATMKAATANISAFLAPDTSAAQIPDPNSQAQ